MTLITLVGIGTGHPEHVTLMGLRALREAATVLIPDKGAGKEDLAHLRHAILDASGSTARRVPFAYPVRDAALPYAERVARWHDAIAARWQAAMGEDPGPVALLVWGDPGLYDSTLRIARRLDPAPDLRVVPGITAPQALAAAHGVPLTALDGVLTVTTGRRLRADGWPAGADTVAVMLDAACSFTALDPALTIWWGAYLGMVEQILDHGPLAEAGPRIAATRAAARARHGWIMDTYLLRA